MTLWCKMKDFCTHAQYAFSLILLLHFYDLRLSTLKYTSEIYLQNLSSFFPSWLWLCTQSPSRWQQIAIPYSNILVFKTPSFLQPFSLLRSPAGKKSHNVFNIYEQVVGHNFGVNSFKPFKVCHHCKSEYQGLCFHDLFLWIDFIL